MAFKIKLIDYGGKAPTRAHYNDAGADVYSTMTVKIAPGQTEKIPLGIGVKIPDGYVALMTPRSGLSSKGIETAVGTIDSGYRGELSASVSNVSGASYTVKEGDRVGQLVVLPVALVDFTFDMSWENERGADGFGSTGK
jgi:dUTP pyrophosphatase